MNDRFSADDLPRTPARDQRHGSAPIDLAHSRQFRIGDSQVFPAAREIVRGDRREVVEPLVMQVLIALARARGEILSRDDLIDACWGGRAVTDDAVNRVISRLRALGRDFESFQVETITKVGYRLVEQGDAAPGSFPGLGRRPLLIGVGALAVASVAGLFAWSRYGSSEPGASIAVVPFANLSGDPARQYFADGLAEELRTALARINRLKVIGRTSSESVRNMDARAAARALGVEHVLLGSVRESATTVRVSAQLIDGSDGVSLWSATYDRNHGDILAIQTDIASNVAQALVPRLAPIESAILTAGGTTSAAAHDLMLKALALDASSDTEEAQRRALGFLDAAIALDPKYAEAHASRSLRLSQIATNYLSTLKAMHAMYEDAVRAARRAVELTPNLASGFSALGWALQYQLNFGSALAYLERSYRLGRGDARTIRVYATNLWRIGRTDEALRYVGESAALDPLHPRHQQMIAQVHLASGRYKDAADTARRTLALASTRIEARNILAISLTQLGRTHDAMAEIAELPQGSLRRMTCEAILYDRIGDKASSDRTIAEIRTRHSELASYELAAIHAQRGEKDRAHAMLENAWRQRDPDLARLAADRLFDPLRGEERFAAIIKNLKLPS